ncbi:MAG: hypothetical protein HY902_05485, partial [Deltaproteobacteria bacterium]|nr:hypothetical protein [Deltaproteobacteria bacterium]
MNKRISFSSAIALALATCAGLALPGCATDDAASDELSSDLSASSNSWVT